jgi:hypothetical protein
VTQPPQHPDKVQAIADGIARRYTIRVHHSRNMLFPWWATITHGCFHIGYPGDSVWRARSRDGLITRVSRWIERDARKQGIQTPEITIEERTP